MPCLEAGWMREAEGITWGFKTFFFVPDFIRPTWLGQCFGWVQHQGMLETALHLSRPREELRFDALISWRQ